MTGAKQVNGSVLDAAAEHRITKLAIELGEHPAAILREVRRRTPAGRLILRFSGLGGSTVLRGRPRDDDRRRRICSVVDVLRFFESPTKRPLTPAEAFKQAPAVLARAGVCGPKGKQLTLKSVRAACRKERDLWVAPEPWDDPSDS